MLYRFLKRQYVDLFHREGKLRLNPLHSYRFSPDNRQDSSEGIKSTRISGVGTLSREQSRAIFGVDNTITFGHGGALLHNLHLPNGFLISTSTRYHRSLFDRFDCDGCFAITDADAFKRCVVSAINPSIPVVRVVNGLVVYVDERHVEVDIPNLVGLGAGIREASIADYFVKSRNPYEVEAEYRFLFLVDSAESLQPLDVQLNPDSVRACCDFNLPPPAA